MVKKIDSLKHPADTRAHIPSHEEAGYEDENKKVKEGTKVLETPKNPVVHRGQDPELFWLKKYDHDDRDELLRVDIRSLYRHEHIAPETLIENLYKVVSGQWIVDRKTGKRTLIGSHEPVPSNHYPLSTNNPLQTDLFSNINELFGNALEKDELDKVSEYYHHQDGWTNRLIQGDSLLTMGSLLEREGMAGQVQMIYFDPPYGIKYGSNWQIKLNNRDVKDGSDEALTGEPEQIKAFRDTWELGIHSYLSYMRDRLLIARELLTESGSCFVQISDENVHLLRSVMDEVFGSENFVGLICFAKTSGFASVLLSRSHDYILWYSKDINRIKYRQLYLERTERTEGGTFNWIELKDGTSRRMSIQEKNMDTLSIGRRFRASDITSSGESKLGSQGFDFEGVTYYPAKGNHWKTTINGLENLVRKNRIIKNGKNIAYKRYEDDFPFMVISDVWEDTILGTFSDKLYIVQTGQLAIERCLLMTTDPGDLVLDPTCGSGTTAFVAEQFGRRWITIDTSRIAINIAKQRIMTAVFPYYKLYDETKGDIRQGFLYKTVPHITLKSLANDEPAQEETLYDQPLTDKSVLRVSGPFTVETLQNFEPVSSSELEEETLVTEEVGEWEEKIKQHLLSTGIKNGRKDERVDFTRVELLADAWLHAEGFYQTAKGEHKAYFHIGPRFGTVSKEAVNKAIVACRQRGDANWLVILGFSFESDIQGGEQTTSIGSFEVTKAKIHDDLLQEGLKKKPAKSAASFITIGEPDVRVDSCEWILDSLNFKICLYDSFKKLSGIDSLAEINGLGKDDLHLYCLLSQSRNVWADLADQKGLGVGSGQHSGGSGKEHTRGISPVPGVFAGLFGGSGDFDSFIATLGLSDERKLREFVETLRRNQQDVARLIQIPPHPPLTPTINYPLTANHYFQLTIEGLDIYDPIRDEVKARNIHEIAYWMLDDDYDGSNFVVKQVFFCGGDKTEFDKWKRGLGDLSESRNRRKKELQDTLKIEIDEDAFDRLYGHTSHPLDLKQKGQKIAVRIVSQYGEESTKIITLNP